jgi:hypothetical protein
MHSAIFFAKPISQLQTWEEFVAHVDKKIGKDKSAVRLAENVWLLNVRESPTALGWLIGLAENAKIPYGILPFERAPEWLPASFDPRTT